MISLLLTRMLPFAALVALLLAGLRMAAPARFADRLRAAARAWPWVGGAMVLVFLAGLGCSLALPVAMDMVEVTVAELAALFLRGAPLYTTLDAAHRYSLLYGPLCALPFAAGLWLFGSSMATLKAVLAGVDAAALLLLFVAFRRQAGRAAAIVGVGAVASALMMRNLSTFQVRGDALLVACVALALVAVGCRRAGSAAVLFAVALGCAVDVKFTAVFLLLVPLWLLWKAHGWAAMAFTLAGGALVAGAPFLLRPVGLRAYLQWLAEAAHHPLSPRLLVSNFVALAIVLVPLAVLWVAVYGGTGAAVRRFALQHRVLLALLAISLLGSAVTGGKVGAGRSHLNGTIVVLAALCVRLWARIPLEERRRPALLVAAAVYAPCLLVPALLQLQDLVRIGPMRRTEALRVLHELDSIRAAHPDGPIEMGYDAQAEGGDPVDPLTLYRTRYVLAGGPVTVDAAALFDMGLSGLPLPAATVDALRRCEVRTWVLPASDAPPFTTRNGYADDAPARFPDPMLFSADFRRTFVERYRRVGRSRHFDVWTCRTPAGTVSR